MMDSFRQLNHLSQKQDSTTIIQSSHPTDALIRSVSNASYRSEPAGSGSFTLFPALPVELRVRIWHHIISIPRIVEMEKIPSWIGDRLDGERREPPDRCPDQWHYKVKNLPPLLSTCSESRQEILKASRSNFTIFEESAVHPPSPAWIRIDHDILHLKARTWQDRGGQWCVHRWFDNDIIDPRACGRHGPKSKMRLFFSSIQILAVNIESFRSALGGMSVEVIRELFPNLKLLIVLIDPNFDVTKVWKFRGGDLVPYWGDEYNPFFQSWAFMTASTGPFTTVQTQFQGSTKTWLQGRFTKEEKNYQNYVAPNIVVLGCALPPGVKIPACGRISSRGVESEPKKTASFGATNYHRIKPGTVSESDRTSAGNQQHVNRSD
jgi:hypothetical protein